MGEAEILKVDMVIGLSEVLDILDGHVGCKVGQVVLGVMGLSGILDIPRGHVGCKVELVLGKWREEEYWREAKLESRR